MTDFLTRLETELRDAHGRRAARGPVRRAVDAAPRALAPALATVAALACGAVLAITLAGGDNAGAPAGTASRPLQTLPASAQGTPVAVLNATTTRGLARRVANLLAKAGADIVLVSDAASRRTGETVVLYAPGHRAAATAVAAVLGSSPAPPHTVIPSPGSGTVTTTPPRTITAQPPVVAGPPRTVTVNHAVTAPPPTAPAPPPTGSATVPAVSATTPLREVLRTVAASTRTNATTVPFPAQRLRPILTMAIRIARLDASTRALAGPAAQVVVVAGNPTAGLLDRPATAVPGHYERLPAYPSVTPAVTRTGCPSDALPLGRFGPRQAGLAVREAWNPKDLPKLRSAVMAAKSDRATQVRHACGQAAVERSAVVELDLVARHPSASLSQVVVFVSRTTEGWRIWQRAH
jgi:LytR cell envelope-related transcriptional attenuator